MKQISPEEAHERMDDEDFIILDVREEYEIEAASVRKFVHIPMREIPARMDELPQDKSIAVMCHHGSRSARVTQFLEQQGFDNVANIRGGIEEYASSTPSEVPRYQKFMGKAKVIS